MKKSTQSSGMLTGTETKTQAVQPAAQRAGTNSSTATALADSPRMTAQRKQLNGAFGSSAQLEKKKLPTQKKADSADTLQLADPKKKLPGSAG